MYGVKGEVSDEEDYIIPIGKARIGRAGTDVTIVAHQKCYWLAMEAAARLEEEGYSAEIIDPRTIRPLDIETIQESVRKTNRLVVVDESNPFASFSSEVTYQVQERLFDYLDAPVIRVTAKDVPAPYAKNLIEYYMPRVEEIVAAAKRVMYAK
jgi:pyruvate dehydrogenase E1 component beta subunit